MDKRVPQPDEAYPTQGKKTRSARGGKFRDSKLARGPIENWPASVLLRNCFFAGTVIAMSCILWKGGTHHGRPYYGDSTSQIYLYFWEDTSNSGYWTGWYLGDSLGGDFIWQRAFAKGLPRGGWLEPPHYHVTATSVSPVN
jgi:hypothetical protein